MITFKTYVEVSGKWSTNACVYATKKEAEAAGTELLSRWFVPTASEARESSDPVNYKFDFQANRSLPLKSNTKLSDALIAELKKEGLLEQEPVRFSKPAVVPRPASKPAVPNPVQAPSKQQIQQKPVAPKPAAPKTVAPKPVAPKPVEKPKSPELQKLQYQIFKTKLRVGKLATKTAVKKFLISLHDFTINISKNDTDKRKIQTYSTPVKGDIESVIGVLQSLKNEFDKLAEMTQDNGE